jgi:hypothetical protein
MHPPLVARECRSLAPLGIDGRPYLHGEHRSGKTKQIIFPSKPEACSQPTCATCAASIEREEAQVGVLISMKAPRNPCWKRLTRPDSTSLPDWNRCPRIQILTIEELLAGKRVEYPRLLEVPLPSTLTARILSNRRPVRLGA